MITNTSIKQDELLKRLRMGVPTPLYLIFIDVIQCIAFIFFAYMVHRNYSEIFCFEIKFIQVKVFLVFLLIATVWKEFVTVAIRFVWIPKTFDIGIFLVLGGAELFIIRFIKEPQYWFLGMFLFWLATFIAYVNIFASAKKYRNIKISNKLNFDALKKFKGITVWYAFTIMVTTFLFWINMLALRNENILLESMFLNGSLILMFGFVIRALFIGKKKDVIGNKSKRQG